MTKQMGVSLIVPCFNEVIMNEAPSWMLVAHRYIDKALSTGFLVDKGRLDSSDIEFAREGLKRKIFLSMEESSLEGAVVETRTSLLRMLDGIHSGDDGAVSRERKVLQSKLEQAKEGLTILIRVFRLQKEKWEQDLSSGRAFAPVSQAGFISKHMEYAQGRQSFTNRLRAYFGVDFPTLVTNMGFHTTPHGSSKENLIARELSPSPKPKEPDRKVAPSKPGPDLAPHGISGKGKASGEAHLSSHESELWDRCRKDKSARNELVLMYDFLAKQMARKYQTARYSYEDALQDGLLGLLRATRDYNPERGSFENYARWWIKSRIIRARQKETAIRIPAGQHEFNMRVVNAYKHLGPNAKRAAVAAYLEVSEQEVSRIEAAMLSSWTKSLDAPLKDDDRGEGLHRVLGDEECGSSAELTEGYLKPLRQRFMEELQAACAHLNQPERALEIFLRRYPLGTDGKGETLEAIGEHYRVARQTILNIVRGVSKVIEGNARLAEMLNGMSRER